MDQRSRETELIEHWRHARPKMCSDLGPKPLKRLAFMLDEKRFQPQVASLEAGLRPAEEQAGREWCLR